MIFVTTTSPTYQKPWIFPTLGLLGCRVVCLLHPDDKRPIPVNCERVAYEGDNCYQDGRFLEEIPLIRDSDVVILADADAVVQRDFNLAEKAQLNRLADGFALGYNLRPGQTGEEEYKLLGPTKPIEEVEEEQGLPENALRNAWIYNTGLMAARAKTWYLFRQLYQGTFGNVTGPELGLSMPSWMQYLICATLYLQGIPVDELSYETHSHGHFAMTEYHTAERRQLYYRGKLVFFAHNVGGVSH